MTIYNPKPEIYQKLCELGYPVSQSSQNIFNEVPAITYRISANDTQYDMDKQISRQDIIVTIDIWANESTTASRILGEVETKMIGINYRLKTSLDVPAPTGTLAHANATFVGIR